MRQGIADSTHQISHWGAPGVIVHADVGIDGCGYSGTHAHLPTDRPITSCIADAFAPLLIGQDPSGTQHLWQQLFHFPPMQWVGRGGITYLALGAIDVALWDIKAKAAKMPLWQLLGGNAQKKISGYNTDGGWLNWDDDTLVSDCRKLVEQDGFSGIKMKIGSPNVERDLHRIELMRTAIGPRTRFMVDADFRSCRISTT
jgi:L-alanine-DL-glutamate epimerase-like enolase superfamily enzyme